LGGLFIVNQSNNQNTIKNLSFSIEPCFYSNLNDTHDILNYLSYKRSLNYFEYILRKNSKNLLCHVQRIQLTLLKQNKEHLFAALCDLFLILDKFGLPLRKRMLYQSKKYLDNKQIEFLSCGFKQNSSTTEIDTLPEHSFFKKESVELLDMCQNKMPEPDSLENITETVSSYVENSQFDIALEYLTEQLDMDPVNEPLTLELIKLYKMLDSKSEFKIAYDKYADHLITSKYWDDAMQHFLEEK